ncbi:hypothetical protein GCM10023332_18800 [Luteimonas vadosa]|uniref:LPS-assembly lipoprotein LptE n=2 Tax=Luteimonas vadosa TaxID=1165507 RepID=A0ABP9E2T5_9GAMM
MKVRPGVPATLARARRLVQTARMKTFLLIPGLLVMLALSACGFHLRGGLALPSDIGAVRVVSSNPNSALVYALEQSLRRAGADMAAGGNDDVAALTVVGERWGDTPISVDQFGRAQEFTLRYAVIFRFEDADGEVLVPQQAIELSRDYISVPTASSGTEGEREILSRELQKEMTASILRRIGTVLKAPRAVAP